MILDTFQSQVTALLLEVGIEEEKALSLSLTFKEKVRRALTPGSFTRPAILVSDERATQDRIILTIRTDREVKVDPLAVLTDYLKKQKIPGTWSLKPTFTSSRNVVVFHARPTTPSKSPQTARRTRKTERSIISEFNKLSEEEQTKILLQLQPE